MHLLGRAGVGVLLMLTGVACLGLAGWRAYLSQYGEPHELTGITAEELRTSPAQVNAEIEQTRRRIALLRVELQIAQGRGNPIPSPEGAVPPEGNVPDANGSDEACRVRTELERTEKDLRLLESNQAAWAGHWENVLKRARQRELRHILLFGVAGCALLAGGGRRLRRPGASGGEE
ncbi:MAG: hypothetical protein L0Z62_36125 [Gemmataceae bacterium]|nr:hypothetical protein [Gemmataceae bacterium]